jgi:titin
MLPKTSPIHHTEARAKTTRPHHSRSIFRPCLLPLEDRSLPSCFAVTTNADGGPGSLRQAIIDANANGGANVIRFSIGEGGAQSIALTSPLPIISAPVIIDGTSQPGYLGAPLIELTGSNAGTGASGFVLAAGHTTLRGMVVSDFDRYGVLIQGPGDNVIAANYIGTDPTGLVPRANRRGGVIFQGNSDANTIGGNSPAARNVISGNGVDDIDVQGADNVIDGNYLGTDATGTQRLGYVGGVVVSGNYNVIGGTAQRCRNVIADELVLTGTGAVVQGNFIGTDATGARALAGGGVFINGTDHLVGGTIAEAGNLISGNGPFGIDITGGASRITVQGNLIGTDVTGTVILGNGTPGSGMDAGVWLQATNSLIGGTEPGARNIISGNDGEGIAIRGNNNRVEGNYIGTDITGTVALPNAGDGITIAGGFGGPDHDNVIGGTEPSARNLISGNAGDGIRVSGVHNFVEGNLIGTDAAGTIALGNEAGVSLGIAVFPSGQDNQIGGTAPGAGNVISGNRRVGIWVFSNGNSIEGNRIGTDLTGNTPLANDGGVSVGGAGNRVGGTAPGAGNLLSGNRYEGAFLSGTDNSLEGNFIGTNATGTNSVANHQGGVTVSRAARARVGGGRGAANLISGNGGNGISVDSTSDLLVAGNQVGVDACGRPLPNSGNGIVFSQSSDNTIGGVAPETRNLIAFNGADGILIDGGTENALRGNAIYGHDAALGIELTNGGNHDQESPGLNSAVAARRHTTIAGALTSAPDTTFTLEFFANTTPNPSGYGEGEHYLGSTMVTTDADGTASFTFRVDMRIDPGQWISATATDPAGNTSSFAYCVEVTTPSAEPDSAGAELVNAAAITETRAPSPPAQFYLDFTTPFYSYNRPGAKPSQSVIQNWWRQAMMGGAKAQYDGIKAFSETDFTEDLKVIDVEKNGDRELNNTEVPGWDGWVRG